MTCAHYAPWTEIVDCAVIHYAMFPMFMFSLIIKSVLLCWKFGHYSLLYTYKESVLILIWWSTFPSDVKAKKWTEILKTPGKFGPRAVFSPFLLGTVKAVHPVPKQQPSLSVLIHTIQSHYPFITRINHCQLYQAFWPFQTGHWKVNNTGYFCLRTDPLALIFTPNFPRIGREADVFV